MENGLKKCPFCGSDEVCIIDRIDCSDGLHTYYHVKCKKCGGSSGEYNTQFDAIIAWNRRESEV